MDVQIDRDEHGDPLNWCECNIVSPPDEELVHYEDETAWGFLHKTCKGVWYEIGLVS